VRTVRLSRSSRVATVDPLIVSTQSLVYLVEDVHVPEKAEELGDLFREKFLWATPHKGLLLTGQSSASLPHRLMAHSMVVSIPAVDESVMADCTLLHVKQVLKPFGLQMKPEESVRPIVEAVQRFVQVRPRHSLYWHTQSLRDILGPLSGIRRASRGAVTTRAKMMDLVFHEIDRTFGDRMRLPDDERVWESAIETLKVKYCGVGIHTDQMWSDITQSEYSPVVDDNALVRVMSSHTQHSISAVTAATVSSMVRALRRGHLVVDGPRGMGKQTFMTVAVHGFVLLVNSTDDEGLPRGHRHHSPPLLLGP